MLRLAGYGYPSSFLTEHSINGKIVYINNIIYTSKFFTHELINTPISLI
jgi:hypothetical protein